MSCQCGMVADGGGLCSVCLTYPPSRDSSEAERVDSNGEGVGRNSQLPAPTHFTMIEGGKWHPWGDVNFRRTKRRGMEGILAHSIKFADGTVFDMVNGWRV